MRKDQGTSGAGEAGGEAGGLGPDGQGSVEGLSGRALLRVALEQVGLQGEGVEAFADAAMVVGSLSQGRGVAGVELGFEGASARAADAVGEGGRPRSGAAPGSMEDHLHRADRALTAAEAITSVQARLDGALVVAVREQTTAIGSALLAEKDIADPGELSATASTRWRGRTKRRSRSELVPAVGWTDGEVRHLVGLSVAPVAFAVPVLTQMSRGFLPWRLARGLWRACEGLPAADAAHVATVMCGDDPRTCVPERLTPGGDPVQGPWEHRAFWTALAREVAKVTTADDPDGAEGDGDDARAARAAAYAARGVHARVEEDGTGALTLITSAFWVGAIKDRLDRAARSARAAGDARTLDQLQSDIARTLLAHATIGFADAPDPTSGTTSGGGDGEAPGVEELLAAGWTPELVQALSGLPPAVLQVIVPLIGLHDPSTAHTLPTVARPATRPHPNTHPGWPPEDDAGAEADGPRADDAGAGDGGEGAADEGDLHTGRAGCPSCTPSRRTHQHHDHDGNEHGAGGGGQGARGPGRPDRPAGEDECAHHGQDWHDHGHQGHQDWHDHHDGQDCRDGQDHDDGSGSRGRRLWVGQVLGAFGMFLSPGQVRELALSPGTTMARLLVDPADGRCVERTIKTYRMDTAMRTQLLAADVTCRAPACQHTGTTCQIDHVIEHGTPDGDTAETNAQLLHTGHHEPKTAKAWDATLAANRDITWTSLLGRIYQTRGWDYRRYVTLLVDAIDAVRAAPPQHQEDELNRQVYLALTHRHLQDRLNPGEDDLEPEIDTTRPWPGIRLTHRDPRTGERAPGPSTTATTQALATRATHSPGPDDPDDAHGPTNAGSTPGISTQQDEQRSERQDERQPGERQDQQHGERQDEQQADPSDPEDHDEQPETHDQQGSDPAEETIACTTCNEDHPRTVGRHDYHRLHPPRGIPHKAWAQHILDRINNGEDCPPF